MIINFDLMRAAMVIVIINISQWGMVDDVMWWRWFTGDIYCGIIQYLIIITVVARCAFGTRNNEKK